MLARNVYVLKRQSSLENPHTVIDLEKGILRTVRAGNNLTARQLAIMLSCRDQPRTVRWLATDLKISKPSVSRAADKLGDAKFTARRKDPDDRRSVLIALTATGRKYLDSLLGD